MWKLTHSQCRLLLSCKRDLLLVAEKELNELLIEVFDGYVSDTEETPATADVSAEPDVSLPSTSDVDTQAGRSSRGPTPRNLRSADRGKDADDAEAACLSHQDADNDVFHYPGHIPPLKYISV